MTGRRTSLMRIAHVELRVRQLHKSVEFYRDVFGLIRRQAMPPSDKVCVCVGAPASGGEEFSLVLAEGLPLSTELAGLDHVSFIVPTEQDVRDAHARASELGFRCTAPRNFDGNFQTFIFDPDGYKLEVTAQHTGNGSSAGG